MIQIKNKQVRLYFDACNVEWNFAKNSLAKNRLAKTSLASVF